MTQHIFDNNGYNVRCGWDRPLQGFFLLIENDDQDNPIYSSLDKFTFLKDFKDHQQRLEEMGISIPCGLLSALKRDKQFNAGNDITVW